MHAHTLFNVFFFRTGSTAFWTAFFDSVYGGCLKCPIFFIRRNFLRIFFCWKEFFRIPRRRSTDSKFKKNIWNNIYIYIYINTCILYAAYTLVRRNSYLCYSSLMWTTIVVVIVQQRVVPGYDQIWRIEATHTATVLKSTYDSPAGNWCCKCGFC